MKASNFLACALMAAVSAVSAPVSRAALMAGLGEVSGTVEVSGAASGAKELVFPVYLYNKEKHVAYSVFVVDGAYRATNMFPGRYEITFHNGYAPSEIGLEMPPVSVDVDAGKRSVANLAPKRVAPKLNYVESRSYPDGIEVQPYDEIYPHGPGRKILEHSCIVCHGVNFIPGYSLNRDGWQALIDRMIKPAQEGGSQTRFGTVFGPPVVGHERLSPEDLPVLLEYLDKNFGLESKPRAVLQEAWPRLDRAVLAKAQWIEYRMPYVPGTSKRRSAAWSMNIAPSGNVYVTDFGAGLLWRLDPETGETKSCPMPDGESGHNLVVDGDETVWLGALGPLDRLGEGSVLVHIDPKTCLADRYKFPETGSFGHTPLLALNGDVWVTMINRNALAHWERATDKVSYYLDPVPDALPYGLDIDHQGKVWFGEYFGGAITRFDPETKTFKRFKVQTFPNNLRRLGADSKNNMWFATWGNIGKNGFLGRISATTGDMVEFTIPIEYSHPYDVQPDPEDNIWVAQDNYLAKFDQKTLGFTIYPVPERTDMIKLEIAQSGAVWTTPRSAGSGGYGAAAIALYPDKDAMTTLRAQANPKLTNNHIAQYRGPFTRITGTVKWQKPEPQNQVDYKEIPRGEPLDTSGKSTRAGKGNGAGSADLRSD